MENSSTSSTPVSLDDISAQISKLKDMLNERYAKLADDEKKIEQEKVTFDAAHKLVSTFKDPIKLNVGGKIFMTSKSTLLKAESMLSAMFSGRHTLEKGEDGAYFIDRDPKHFGKILNFLRDGEFEMHKDEVEKKEIIREAEYYSMTALVEYLCNRLVMKFDQIRKGPNVVINGTTASLSTVVWQSVLVASSITKGVHSCTFSWHTGSHIMFGVTGANLNNNAWTSGAYLQAQSMMLQSAPGHLRVAGGQLKTLEAFSHGVVTVELDCDNRTVTWVLPTTNRFTEPLHANLQAPFSFCVDLYGNSATLTALK